MENQVQVQGKYNLELNFVDDRIFLDFWDSVHGDDVLCQVIDGKLYKCVYSNEEAEDDQEVFEKTEISLQDFINLVKKTVSEPF